MSQTAAERFADFVAHLSFEQLPSEVVQRAKELTLDLLGVGLAASAAPASRAVLSVARSMGGARESTVLGTGEKLPAPNAALANGTMAHGLDYDDTQLPSQAHMSASVIPAALASAEATGADGKALIAACVAGWEVGLRIGGAAPGKFTDSGFHPTAILGTFASAVVAGSLHRLSAQQLVNALGIAGSQAAGLQAYLDNAAWVKKMHPGWAAHGGCISAMLAREGFTGPSTVFEGRFGLFNTHIPSKDFDLSALVAGLGASWQMQRISIKPYPACHISHPCMDAALVLKNRHGIDPAAIEHIHCQIAEPNVPLVCVPWEEKLRPAGEYAARFSLPFSVAVVLLSGKGGLGQFTDATARDPEILGLASKVSYSVDPDAAFPRAFSGVVRITMRDGTAYEHREAVHRGSPERPMSEADVVAKFRDCVSGVLDHARADRVVERVLSLERQPAISPLLELCVSASGA